jgi:sugar phosphate isomerase/epimerase
VRINIYSHGHDVDGLIARCRQLGVADVGYACAGMPGVAETGVPDRERLRGDVDRLRAAGIAVPVALKWFGNDPAVVLRPREHRREIDAACRTIETLGAAGVPTVLHYIDLAQSPRADDDEPYWEGLVGVFGELVAAAESANVRLANHAIWRCIPDQLRDRALADGVTLAGYREYRPDGWHGPYLLTSAEHIARLLEAVPSPHNGVCFCTGMHMMGGDLPRLTEQFAGKVFYAQMRDLRGRWPAAEEVFPGTGELDFPQILAGLRRTGYDGVFGPEHLGNPRLPGEDLEAGAVAYFQEVLAGLGR